jgi:hypothetical protein
MAAGWTWDEMIGEFRALGGAAENVCVRRGRFGRGLFPVDSEKPVSLFVPENLLLNVTDVMYDNGSMRLKPEAQVGLREKDFFERYQANFNWGAGGRDDCAAFIDAMDTLPSQVRGLLASDFGLAAFFQGDKTNRIQQHFLKSRMIGSKGRFVLMPVMELVNYSSNGAIFKYENGIAVTGRFADEILIHYLDVADPFTVFSTWGFAHEEPFAFSLAMTMRLGNRRLIVQRQLLEKAPLGIARAPVVEADDKTVTLSHLMLGNARRPRLAKGVFYRILHNLGESNAEEAFDRIQHFNRMKFLQLLKALESHEGPVISTLRKMVIYQLQALSHCIGVRPL